MCVFVYVQQCRLCVFFNDTATTEIYTLSLHDALPISPPKTPTKNTTTNNSNASMNRSGSGHSTHAGKMHSGVGSGGGKDRKSTRLNSSHANISYAVFCLKKKTHNIP